MNPKGVCPEEEALHFIASEKDKDIFQKKFISEDKGYGVIATKNIEPGEFLLEYVGRHITGSEGEDLYKEYSAEDAAFLYFYNFQEQNFCIDGSKETRLGRFINDDHIKPNSKIKIVLDEQQKPHLCVFAITEILAGEEIVYDYETPNCQWRQDGTHTTNYGPETLAETDIAESTDNDLFDISDCNPLLSSSVMEEEEEFSEFEMVIVINKLSFFQTVEEEGSRSLVMSDEKVDDNSQSKEEETTEREVILRKTPSKTQQKSHGSNSQQHNVTVKTSSNTSHHRVYDKKNYCFYCGKPYAKITRHLKQKHSDQPDVARALAYRKGSKMHSLLLTKVANMGNYQHNCSVLSSGEGQIIPKRQATCEVAATNYLPCKFCFAMYVKTDLWRHLKRCKLRGTEASIVTRRVQTSSSMMLPMNTVISTGLKTVLQEMTYDNITLLVKADSLIISLGERMFLKNGEVGRHRADIRNKMRELARLVLVARDIDKDVVFLKDLICPRKFNTVLEAVKQMTGFNELSNRFAVPSTALKLRHSLVKVSYILQGEALRVQDDDLKSKAEQFVKLIELDWSTHVSSNALKTLYQKKWNLPQILPLSEDIKKLQDHLKSLEVVCDQPTAKSWSELAQVTLTQLILFNRRREGEVSRMELNTYLQRNQHDMHDEVLESLSKLCENLARVEVRGKRGRKVPVLFTTNIKQSVELLIKTREEVGISPTNPYIFARPFYGSQGNFRGCDSLKRFAESCGAKQPQNLTSTKLRKHIATVSQLLNLQTHELDQLATFMGHDIEVHREFYRLPEETLQVAKVSRLLFALQGGMSKFKGKSLEDITPNINSEEKSSDSDSDVQSEGTPIKKSQKVNEKALHHARQLGALKYRQSRQVNMHIMEQSLSLSQMGKSRRPWSDTERKVIHQHFKDFLKKLKIPGKVDCQKCLNNNQILKDNERDWKAIKYFMYNKIAAIKKS
uniref:SET domain-containing protein n=1 Tax=Poecilia formosa TaxID=48698 RepID=A0A087XM20_POEFO